MNPSIFNPFARGLHRIQICVLFTLSLATGACHSVVGPSEDGDNDSENDSKFEPEEQPDDSEKHEASQDLDEDKEEESKGSNDEADPQHEDDSSDKPEEPDHHKANWDYEVGGDMGPDVWGDLSKTYAACKVGQAQSPIDISQATRDRKMPDIDLDYAPAAFEAVDNGHTVQLNFPAGRLMKVDDKVYELLQLHYHTESEHTIRGKRYPMELHLVHKSNAGELAVLGVMVKSGGKNNALKTILDHLPDPGKTNKEPNLEFDPSDLLPASLHYFGYDGSLTTPPCTEGVKWHVLRTPITASKAQLEAFKGIYGQTYRPVQPLNEREIVSRYDF